MLATGSNRYKGKINILIKKLLIAAIKANLFDR